MTEESDSRVKIDIQEINTKGFDGFESVITVITLIASGVAGGLTAAIGESVWNGVRKVIAERSLGRGPDPQGRPDGNTVVVVIMDAPEGRLKLSCKMRDERDLDVFVESLDEIEASSAPGQNPQSHRRYNIVDGEWEEV